MEYYSLVKHLHMTAASLSFIGFMIRGVWMLIDNNLLQAKLTKIIPHIIDTMLLASAIYLVIILQAYPSVINWITIKIVLLILYIVIGTIALKRGKTKQTRVIAFLISVLIILGIFATAFIKPVFVLL